MAATRGGGEALATLMRAALALPILAVPAQAGAVELSGEAGFTLLGYKERGLMKVTQPIAWARVESGPWEARVSGAVDIVTGASPQLVSNATGRPVQTVTGASVSDRRSTADARLARRFGDLMLAISRTVSDEDDYRSRALGLEARADFDERRTTLTAGYGKANDRVRSSDDPSLDERRDTEEYLLGVTRVISPVAAVQSTVTLARGHGWYNDPYKVTLTFFPDGPPLLLPDRRPSSRESVAWLTRYRHHVPPAQGTLQLDYRFYRDDWGIRAHTLEVAWQQAIAAGWEVRPALRYHTQSAADFYGAEAPRPAPAVFSSDQRLGAFGGLSPSLRVIHRFDRYVLEGTLGYVHNARSLRLGGSGSPAFETLRAVYGIVGITREF